MRIRARFALFIALIGSLSLGATFSVRAQLTKLPATSRLGVPGKNWVLQIETNGFVLERTQTADDGFGKMIMATNPTTGLVMSAFLEKAPKKGNSRDAREYYWEGTKKSPFKKDDIRLSDFGEIPIVEYLIKEFQGMQVNQKNVHAYLAKGDVWVDVHLSKVQFKPEDEGLFNSILKSIKIATESGSPGNSSSVNSMSYAQQGSTAYLQGDYRTAIRHYSKAVEATDSSFKRFVKTEKFRAFLSEIGADVKK